MNYRPYKDIYEFRQYYKPNTVIVNKSNNIRCVIGCNVFDWGVLRLYVHGTDEETYECCLYSFKEFLDGWIYEDGTPCGVYY